MTLKIPSSVILGDRPRIDLIRSYSERVRLCFWMISGVMSKVCVVISTLLVIANLGDSRDEAISALARCVVLCDADASRLPRHSAKKHGGHARNDTFALIHIQYRLKYLDPVRRAQLLFRSAL